MKMSTSNSMVALIAAACLLVTSYAAPMHEAEEEQSENALVGRDPGDGEGTSWDAVDTAALRKLLMQLYSDGDMGRVGRSWPAAEPRGWGLRAVDRLPRPWRADKRQVRFRQCYFNPISCFKK